MKAKTKKKTSWLQPGPQSKWRAAGYEEWINKKLPSEAQEESFVLLPEFSLVVAKHGINLEGLAKDGLFAEFVRYCYKAREYINIATLTSSKDERGDYLVTKSEEWIKSIIKRVRAVLFNGGNLDNWLVMGPLQHELVGRCCSSTELKQVLAAMTPIQRRRYTALLNGSNLTEIAAKEGRSVEAIRKSIEAGRIRAEKRLILLRKAKQLEIVLPDNDTTF